MTDKERFPGEREPDTAMPSQPGLMGTTGFGGDLPKTPTDATVSDDMARERANEGGGDAGQRSDERQGSKGTGQR